MSSAALSKAFYGPGGFSLNKRTLAQKAGTTIKQAEAFLKKQEVAQIYRKPPQQKVLPTFNVKKPGNVQQIDTVYLQPDPSGAQHALVAVDVASRTVDAEPLRNRTAGEAVKAIKEIYKRHEDKKDGLAKPGLVTQVDEGSEFKGAFKKFMRDQKVLLRVGEPNRHRSQGVVERANQTIGNKIYRRQVAQELLTNAPSTEWVQDLPEIIQDMNVEAKKKFLVRQKEPEPTAPLSDGKTLLEEGDKVRVALEVPKDVASGRKLHGNFRAGDPRFSTTVHKIRFVWLAPGKPPLYFVEGYKQSFTRNRLLVVKEDAEAPPHTVIRGKHERYVMQAIRDRRVRAGKVEYLLKWKGWPEESNTWEPREVLAEDVPELLKRYEAKNPN